MKKIITILFILINLSAYGQIKTTELSEFNSAKPFILGRHILKTDMESKDSVEAVVISFQNDKYEHLTDIKHLLFSNQESLNEFIKDLTLAVENFNSKDAIDWRKEDYAVSVNQRIIWVFEMKEKGYFMLAKNQANRFLKWLNALSIKDYSVDVD